MSRPSSLSAPADEYLTPASAAAFLGLRPATLARWRSAGRVAIDGRPGPPFYRPAPRVVRYRRSDLVSWAEANGPKLLTHDAAASIT